MTSLWMTDKKFGHTGSVHACKKCGDTAFELTIDSKPQGKCCRCGEKFK